MLVAVTVTVCCEGIVAGAVYNPVSLMVPTAPAANVQTTDVFGVLVIVAANCCVCCSESVAVDGEMLMATAGYRVTVAVAVFVLSAKLVAVTVTVCCEPTVVGAL